MPKVQSYADIYVAQLLVDDLERAGIPARLANTDLVGMVPGVPFTTAYCEVWVDDPVHFDDALEIARRFEQERKASQAASPDDEPVQRVSPGPPSFGGVVFWMAAASLPGAFLYFVGLNLIGVIAAALAAGLSYMVATRQRTDYCSRCQSPLAAEATRCSGCDRQVEQGAPAAEHDQQGGMARTIKTLGVGMLVLFFVLLAVGWCTQGQEDHRTVPVRWSRRPF